LPIVNVCLHACNDRADALHNRMTRLVRGGYVAVCSQRFLSSDGGCLAALDICSVACSALVASADESHSSASHLERVRDRGAGEDGRCSRKFNLGSDVTTR
jgi:hypothetical protein